MCRQSVMQWNVSVAESFDIMGKGIARCGLVVRKDSESQEKSGAVRAKVPASIAQKPREAFQLAHGLTVLCSEVEIEMQYHNRLISIENLICSHSNYRFQTTKV